MAAEGYANRMRSLNDYFTTLDKLLDAEDWDKAEVHYFFMFNFRFSKFKQWKCPLRLLESCYQCTDRTLHMHSCRYSSLHSPRPSLPFIKQTRSRTLTLLHTLAGFGIDTVGTKKFGTTCDRVSLDSGSNVVQWLGNVASRNFDSVCQYDLISGSCRSIDWALNGIGRSSGKTHSMRSPCCTFR